MRCEGVLSICYWQKVLDVNIILCLRMCTSENQYLMISIITQVIIEIFALSLA